MKICVIGTGTMGSGIVQAFAQSGVDVVMKGFNSSDLAFGENIFKKNIQRLLDKGVITTNEQQSILDRVISTTNYDDCIDCDFFIEAIVEKMEVKKELFSFLHTICKPSAIFASNTSSLSITEIASSSNRPDKMVGMHFFNPAPVMKLVEVINGQLTSKETQDFVFNLAKEIGKTPVIVNEAPGFVVNRILIPMINEAIGILAEGVASKEDIDSAMKMGANHPMGPLALADLIGLDICLDIMEVLHREFGEDKYRPHPLLRKMVRSKQLGRKTKIGFYQY
jgi:3-hydroxybutyryl-CoA dehydrogenase